MEPKEAFKVLGLHRPTTSEEVDARYRQLATERHPDRGGSDDDMAVLNDARTGALRLAGGLQRLRADGSPSLNGNSRYHYSGPRRSQACRRARSTEPGTTSRHIYP